MYREAQVILKNFCIFIGLIITGLFLLAILRPFFPILSIDNLPTGELLGRYESPDKRHRLSVYRCDGDATVDYAVRAAVLDKRKPYTLFSPEKNIYWQYRCNNANVQWLDQTTVRINDKILNVERDVYDWRLH